MPRQIRHKRFYVTLAGMAFCAGCAIYGIAVEQYTLATVGMGGVQAIAIAFVAGDSYRKSIYDDLPHIEQENTIVISNRKNNPDYDV